MALKLNKIQDAVVVEDIVRNRDRMKKFLAADPGSPMRSDPVRYHERLGDCARELGLELYQQEDEVEEIRTHFARAGENLLNAISLPPKEVSNPALSPLGFETAVGLAVCFCQQSVYEIIDKIPEKHFFNIEDPKPRAFFAILARYMNLLRHFVVSSKLDKGEWKAVESECLRSNASSYDAKVNLSKLRALDAVAAQDVKALNEAIAILVEEHENEAKHGDNQKSSRGFICLPGLMFAQLGSRSKLSCTVKSQYLPLQLLRS